MNSESIATRRLQNGLEEFEQFVDWFTQTNDDDAYEVHSKIARLGTMGPRKFVYLFHDLLELHSPGPKDRKVLEKAAKHMVRKRIRVSRDSYRNEVTLLKTFLATAKSVSRGKRKAASEHVAAGSFKLINMGGFPDKTMKAVAALVKEAEDKLRKLGMESVIYGEIKVVNTIMGTALAHYWPITDEVYVRANIRKGVGVESIIHELAHRFHHKTPGSNEVIEALYRATKRRQEDVLDRAIQDPANWPKAGELIGKPPALGELESRWVVTGTSFGRGPRVELKRLDSDQKGQVSMRGYLEMEGKVSKIFVSRYAMTNATENFAEMVSMYAVGKVNEEQRQVFEQVLNRLGVKSNPTHNRNCPNCGERIDLKSKWVALFDDELFCNVECAKSYRAANEEEGPIVSFHDGRQLWPKYDTKYHGIGVRGANENPAKSKREVQRLGTMVINSLSDDLRLPRYRGNKNKLAGHCYVASEALWHLLGGKKSGWTPMFIQHEGEPHWFLIHRDGTVADLTSSQFSTPVPYDKAMHRAFLSRKPNIGGPSKRARVVLERISRIKRGANENPTNANREIEKLSVDAEAWFDLASSVGRNNPSGGKLGRTSDYF